MLIEQIFVNKKWVHQCYFNKIPKKFLVPFDSFPSRPVLRDHLVISVNTPWVLVVLGNNGRYFDKEISTLFIVVFIFSNKALMVKITKHPYFTFILPSKIELIFTVTLNLINYFEFWKVFPICSNCTTNKIWSAPYKIR